MNLFGNYTNHPTNENITVFKFYILEQAHFFKSELIKGNIWFEYSSEEEARRTIYFFAVKNKDLERVDVINYTAIGMFRKPLIPNIYIRYAIIVISLTLLLIAIIGSFKS